MTAIHEKICLLSELIARRSYGKQVACKHGTYAVFLVYEAGSTYAYVNRCPHTGINLEWQEHRFLNKDKQWIQCSTHGARFRIHDGECIHGPCLGQTLTPLPVVQEGDWVAIDIQPLIPSKN